MGGRPDDGLSPLARSYRAAEPWLAVVWRFTGSVLVGVGMGYWADAKLGVKPAGLVVGGLVGSAVGFYAFVKGAQKLLETKPKPGSESGSNGKSDDER